jgi:hypothetical protein
MRLVLVLSLLTAIASASAYAGNQTRYGVEGDNPGGGGYRGTLTITTTGDIHRLVWETGSTSTGLGVRLGDALAVAVGGDECAVVAYRVNAEGGLEGVWATPKAPAVGKQLGSETAVPGVGTTQGLAGDYVVSGSNPDGKPYKGGLTVFKEADHWRFSWRTLSNFEGYGIERSGRIAVAWGAPTCGVVLYRVDAKGNLDGLWKYLGGAIGAERAQVLATP